MGYSRTNKFLKNILGSALLQVVTIITGFISPKLMLHAFGSEVNGITLSILQFISYISLVEAGLANATIFALYKPLAEKNNAERDAIISATRISYNRVGYIFVGLSVILAVIYPLIGKTDVLTSYELSFLVLVLCLSGCFNFFILSKYRAVLTADQCGYIVSFASAVQLLVNLLIIYITIKLGCGVIVVRGTAICSMFVTTIILSIAVKKKYHNIDFNVPPKMKALNKRKGAMINQLLGMVTTGSPIVILTSMSNFKQLSVYSVYAMISSSLVTCLTIFTSGLASSFGNIYALEDEDTVRKIVMQFMTAYYCILTVLFTIAVVTIVPFVDIYTKGITDVNYHVPLFGFLIILNGVIANLYSPHGMLVQSFGKFNEVRGGMLFQAIIAVLSTVIFIKLWGIVGAMVALCITNLYMLIYMLSVTSNKLIRISIHKNIGQMVLSLIIFVSIYLFWKIYPFQPTTYYQWIFYALIVGVLTILITIIVYYLYDRNNMRSLFYRLRNIVNRKCNKRCNSNNFS